MNELFFEFVYHKPYLHLYVLISYFIIFLTISFLSRNSNKTCRAKANFYFIFSQCGLFIAGCLPFFLAGNGKFVFDKWLDDNFLGAYLSGIILILTFLSKFYIYESLYNFRKLAEFYTTLYFTLIGLILACFSQHLLFIFMALGLTTIGLYSMLALNSANPNTRNLSLQFFLLASFSLTILAFGFSFIYGGTGSFLTFEYYSIIVNSKSAYRPFLEIGTIFIITAIAFQFGVAPFHQWVLETYKKADYATALIVMNITKIAIFVISMRLIITTLYPIADYWKWLILAIAMLSITLGYVGLIAQNSFRKFMAYSAIANLGFVMLALFAVVEIRVGGSFINKNATNAISSDLFYLIYYQFTNVAVFAFAWVLAKNNIPADDIDDFKGLNQRYSWFAFMFATLALSMAGIPPFLGFWAKLAIIQALLGANHPAIITYAILISIFGAYFYLRFIKLIYFDPPKTGMESPITLAKPFRLVLSLHCLLLIGLGLLPAVLFQISFLIMQ